ncbi:MAG: NAD-dependent epimerase/dehydratase family protein [Chloroflexi bacterium]|nr:NAD-dependent epimerase/dehydratase family protein [Chloroflexota bacterium]
MRILIIGGTVFLGRALVDAALQRDHQVTLFNRGRSSPDAYPDIETIQGDRDRNLDRLGGRRWDAVVDTCGYRPGQLRLSTAALRPAVEHYCFISTLSVYPVAGEPNRDETAPLLTLKDDSCEEVSAESYGPLKVGCEAQVMEAFPQSALIIRAGLIVGPYDQTNRFTYWVTRAARGGDAIAPPAQQPLQFIDARDLADFVLRGIERRTSGVYNVTGPAKRLTFGEFLPQAKGALASDVRFHHVSDEFLQRQGVDEFMGLPLWLNQEAAESFMTFSIERALAAGLRFRALSQTIRATNDWARANPDAPKQADLPTELEATLLEAWYPSRRRARSRKR